MNDSTRKLIFLRYRRLTLAHASNCFATARGRLLLAHSGDRLTSAGRRFLFTHSGNHFTDAAWWAFLLTDPGDRFTSDGSGRWHPTSAGFFQYQTRASSAL